MTATAPNGTTPATIATTPSQSRILVRAILTHGAAGYVAAQIAAGQTKKDGERLDAGDVLTCASLWERHIYREVKDDA